MIHQESVKQTMDVDKTFNVINICNLLNRHLHNIDNGMLRRALSARLALIPLMNDTASQIESINSIAKYYRP